VTVLYFLGCPELDTLNTDERSQVVEQAYKEFRAVHPVKWAIRWLLIVLALLPSVILGVLIGTEAALASAVIAMVLLHIVIAEKESTLARHYLHQHFSELCAKVLLKY